MPDALLDLMLGSRCAVCGRPGRVLCPTCRGALPRRATTCWPTPTPPGLARPVAVGEYDGPLKLLVNAHKEQHRFALARPLGDLLATAVLGHIGAAPTGTRGHARPHVQVALVPVPSRGAVVRARGHDPLLRITRRATARLRSLGFAARTARVLRTTRVAQDQAGLGASARALNLAGTLTCPPGRARRCLAQGSEVAPLVFVVDDVITTGATVREAQRALEEAAVEVSGIAVVAATRRTLSSQVDRTEHRGSPVSGGIRVPDYRFAPTATSV